jgi:quinoprotein glucose dehydrogenase
MLPSSAGGMNWGSVAIDEASNTLVTNVLNMPHFAQLIPNEAAENAVAASGETTMGTASPLYGTPYHLKQGPAMSPRFLPCTAPPWAKLVAVDLQRGEIKWEVPLGTIDKLAPVPFAIPWGAPTFAGGIVTAGNLIFIGATADNRFRAFRLSDGKQLWETKLPTGSFAHPMTYAINGKQYVVIISGGHPFVDQDPGDWVTAFVLAE